MIRTVLIDDEPDSIAVLRRLLNDYCPQVQVIGSASGVDSAFELILETNPDLVFLDIEMIQGNAFDLLNRFDTIPFQVIFVTAFDTYAVRAFRYSALDYLLKPVDVDDLLNAVNRVQQRSSSLDLVSQMKTLLENAGKVNGQKMAVPTLDGLSFIPVLDIIRLEAKGSYTSIYLEKGKTIVTTRTIKDYEELLPDSVFFRIHNSHIINLQRIDKYQKGRGGFAIMEDGSSIEIATRRKDEFLRRLLK